MSATTTARPASVDSKEVAHYAALAHTWWDRSGPFWPLHRLNELRVAFIEDRLCQHFHLDPGASRPLAGLRILDIGCGGGILSEAMASRGALVHGVDVVDKNINIARHHAEQSKLRIEYTIQTAEALAQQSQRYDVVLNMEVVEHVADLDSFLQACNRLVRPGGLQFIATINRNPLSWLVAIFGAEYVLRWLPRGTHQWRRLRKPQELEQRLKDDGLEIISRTGVRVNPLNRRMALTRLMSVNYMLVAESAG